MTSNRHSPGYWREYYANNPKLKEKSKRQAAAQKAARHEEFKTRPRCEVCGKPFIGRAISSSVTLTAGVHQKCAPAKWMRVRRGHTA